MPIETIFAHVSCSDLSTSILWYEKLFGQPPSGLPMPGLAEWQFTDSAALQLFEDDDRAGTSTLTLRVIPLQAEVSRLEAAGLAPGPIEEATTLFIVRMRDPDGNLIVLASPHR